MNKMTRELHAVAREQQQSIHLLPFIKWRRGLQKRTREGFQERADGGGGCASELEGYVGSYLRVNLGTYD